MINIIETERLFLRPLTLEDADTAYYGWTGDAEVAEYISWLPHHSICDTVEWLKEIERKQDDMGNILENDNSGDFQFCYLQFGYKTNCWQTYKREPYL